MNSTTTNAASKPASNSSVVSTVPTSPTLKKQFFNGPCYLKMLVSNLVAGSIIGKQGTVISKIEASTDTSMKLSPTSHFFPGTSDRVVVISGEQDAVHEAMDIVIDKMGEVASSQFGPYFNSETRVLGGELTLKLAVPKSAVSGIIGKAGQQIKRLQEESKAKIQISNRDNGLDERIVAITGTLENIHAAAAQVSVVIQEDSNLKDHLYVTYNSPPSNVGGGGGGIPTFGGTMGGASYGDYGPFMGPVGPYACGAFGAQPMGMNPMPSEQDGLQYETCEISMEVPDSLVGYVVGKGGVHTSDIMKSYNVTVKVAAKGAFVPGTHNRKLSIHGPVPQVHRAHARILLRMREGLTNTSPAQGSISPSTMFAAQAQQYGASQVAQNAQHDYSHHPSAFGYQHSTYGSF